ncbi:MAG: hypothetical protein ABI597_05925 [Gammaproteobacteria bacterium]
MKTRLKPDEQTPAEERYRRYLKRTGKFFHESLYERFTNGISSNCEADLLPEQKERSNWKPVLHADEKDYSRAKKLWTDAVSEIDALHHKDKKVYRQIVIRKLEQLHFDKPESVLDACINLMQENSRIVVAFNCPKSVTNFHLRNMHEFPQDPNGRSSNYEAARLRAERYLFNHLTNAEEFLKSAPAQPRYGILFIPDSIQPVDFAKGYGRSFVVLRPAILPASLFFHADSELFANKFSRPCSYFNLEFLLSHFSVKKLQAIATRAMIGKFPDDFYQDWSDPFKGLSYTEVLLPVIDLFDSNYVELLHLDIDDIHLSEVNSNLLCQNKLTVTNQKGSPSPAIATSYY